MKAKHRPIYLQGVEIRPRTNGTASVLVGYRVNGRDVNETAGAVPLEIMGNRRELARHATIRAAHDLLRARRREIAAAKAREERWLSPVERKEQEAERARTQEDARRDLLFEVASERYLSRVEAKADKRGLFRRLGVAFAGAYLDTVTRASVLDYIEARLGNSGPFAGWERRVGRRSAETEVAALSALYTYLEDIEERPVSNPCRGTWGRWRTLKGGLPYRPQRKKYHPTDEELAAIFAAAPSPTYRALFALVWYTAARPESEACAIKHGDLSLPLANVSTMQRGARPWGTVTYRDTKTGVDRKLDLHPEAVEALRPILRREPENEAKREAWAESPVFVNRKGKAFTRQTYRKAWLSTLRRAAKAGASEPLRAGMDLRDMRTAANTRMAEGGTDAGLRAKILGHSPEMNDRHYLDATGTATRSAMAALSVARSGADTGTEAAAAR